MLQLFLTLVAVIGLSVLIELATKRLDKRTIQVGVLAIFAFYVIGNLFFTILSRDVGSGAYLELRPFQSYVRIFGMVDTGIANVTGFFAMLFRGISPWSGILLNILLFYPLGYLLPILFPKLKPKHVILIGCLCSIATEATQYLLKMGWCETDDVLHNTLGTAVGVWVWHLQSKRLNKPKSNELAKD